MRVAWSEGGLEWEWLGVRVAWSGSGLKQTKMDLRRI